MRWHASPDRGMRLTVWTTLLLAAAVGSAQGQGTRPPATPLPNVSAAAPANDSSWPFLAASRGLPPLDLAASGYVEEEFVVSGTANVYDWTADGAVRIKTANAPYTTRILVRRPADAARFSGAVIVEPMYPPRRWDWPMMWGYAHEHFIDHRDVWVGVTLPAAVAGLKKFDAARYAALSFQNPTPALTCATGRDANATFDTEEGLRWDMLSQVGALLKRGGSGAPLGRFRVQSLYLTTQGGDLITYLNAIHSRARLDNGKPVYDGYLAKAPFTAAKISQCAAAPGPDDPRQVVKNAGVPVIAIAAQGEVLATRASRRPDSDAPGDRYRLYEVAGAGHIDKFAYRGFPSMPDQAAAGNAQGTADWPFAARCTPDIPMMDVPIMSLVFNAAFDNLDRWVRQGTAAPRASRLEVSDADTPRAAIVTDQYGHGVGGVRTPFIDVPVAAYATNSAGPGTCREMGHKVPFETARLAALYSSEKSYVARVAEAVDRLVKERWVTESDARRLRAQAASSYPGASR